MQQYLNSVWAMLAPCREDTMPLLETLDLEAHGEGSSDTIVLVCESAQGPVCSESVHVRVSPFSEDPLPMWPCGPCGPCGPVMGDVSV